MADAPSPISRLIEVMARLRDPVTGCLWDREQTFATIAPYTIEEAYEVADAIAAGDMIALKDELGDLLFQVVYYAQMSHEAGGFDFDAVAAHAADKMIRRHPHVFGTDANNVTDAASRSAAAQPRAWEAQKAAERATNGEGDETPVGVLDGVARALPALVRAEKLSKRAAAVGFDWPSVAEVFAKIEEELAEVRREVDAGAPPARLEDEIGDLLFAVANLARKMGLDPERALRLTNDKFTSRFRYIEEKLKLDSKIPADSDLAEMDALWNAAKKAERGA